MQVMEVHVKYLCTNMQSTRSGRFVPKCRYANVQSGARNASEVLLSSIKHFIPAAGVYYPFTFLEHCMESYGMFARKLTMLRIPSGKL